MPERWISAARSRSVGRASRASGRSSARNGRSFLATGLESSTSGSRSSSAPRRLTNVVLARRRNGGQPLDRVGERDLLVADRGRRGREVVDEAGEVVAAVGDVGDELRGRDDEALEQRRVAVELAEQAAGRRQRRVEVHDALAELLAGALVLAPGAAEDAGQRLARVGVEGVEELVEVDRGGRSRLLDRAAVGDRAAIPAGRGGGRCSGSRCRRARPGGPSAGCRGAAARSPLSMRSVTSAWPSSVRSMPVTLPTGRPGDLHEVALDELGGVLEAGLDLVGLIAAEEREARDDACRDQGSHGKYPRDVSRSPHSDDALQHPARHALSTAGRASEQRRERSVKGEPARSDSDLTRDQPSNAARVRRLDTFDAQEFVAALVAPRHLHAPWRDAERLATNAHRASLARPSTGGAVTRITTAPRARPRPRRGGPGAGAGRGGRSGAASAGDRARQ